METKLKPYNVLHRASAIFMMLALLWLTVSLPFVLASNQLLSEQGSAQNAQSAPTSEEETTNSLGNTTEEKAPSNSSVSEEYLHDNHTAEHFLSPASRTHKCENSNIYNAFHGEVHVPPPNVA